jgi:hypothetical protein
MSAVFYAIYLAVSMPVTAIASCAAYLVIVPSVYAATLTRVLVSRPAWLPDAPQWPRAPAYSDPGVLQYFYGPALADVAQVAQNAFDDGQRRWRLGIQTMFRSPRQRGSPLGSPLKLAAAAGMTAGSLLGIVAIAGCVLLHAVVAGLTAVVVRAFSAALRGAGSAISRARDTPMTCPACSEPVPCPSLACPGNGCKRRHDDLRPGQFGVLRRRCGCGAALRTTLFPGSPRAIAFCPRCDQPLEGRPGADTDITLPVFGTSRAARVRVLASMVTQLKMWDRDGQLTAVPTNPVAAREDEHTVRLATKAGTPRLRVLDAGDEGSPLAGRVLEAHSGQSRTFVIAIDPTKDPDELRPDQAYERDRRLIEATGVPAGEARLAIVFTESALPDASSGRLARWARRELGLGDLVRSARRDFKECRFFAAAQPAHEEASRAPAASLMRWLLAPDGIAPSPSRVVTDFRAARERSYRWQRRYVFASMVTSAALLVLLLAS